MKRIAFFLGVIASWQSGGCIRAGEFTEAERRQVAVEVELMLEDYFLMVRAQGLTAEFLYLDSSTDFYWIPPGYRSWLSYDSVLTILRTNAPLLRSVENEWDTLRIEPLSHDLARYAGKIRSVVTDTAGRRTETRLIESGVVIRRSGGWKLLSGQTAVLPE